MVGPAVAVRRVLVARVNDFGFELVCAGQRRIEVANLEPQQEAVAVGAVIGIADRPMVVRDPEPVQLENEGAPRDQPLVFATAVRALAAEQMLIPATAGFDIADRDQGLGTDRHLNAAGWCRPC